MPSVFAGGRTGTVVELPSIRTVKFSLIKTDPDIAIKGVKACVTAFTMDDSVNVQFTHTMGDDIYMNVFGNRMGRMNVDGLAFNASAAGGSCDTAPHGVIDIIKWYKKNRASSRTSPIEVTISGTESIEGFLVAASYSAQDTETWMIKYQMVIMTVPKAGP